MRETAMMPDHVAKPAVVAFPPPRVWPGLTTVAAYWAYQAYKLIATQLEIARFVGYFTWVWTTALCLLLFLTWWLFASRVRWVDRFLGLIVTVITGVVANGVSDPSMQGVRSLSYSLPIVLTAWVIWLAVARNSSLAVRRTGLLAAFCLTWGYFALIRMDGVDGGQSTNFHWRWTPKAEDLFLAARAQAKEAPPPSDEPLKPVVLQEGDWPAFRGPRRDSELSGARIATDWNAAPPKLVWKQRVGPAWSSMAIVGNRLFTQEQRGENEAVVCLDAESGREIWAHEDVSRFAESMAGVGPRATPTFMDGKLYTFGAQGVLNCLDAASGAVHWSRNVATDSGTPVPMWGFSSSPLITNGAVVVCANGAGVKGLVAYRADSGEPAWTAPTGKQSYSSPQLASIAGETQLLFLSEAGVTAYDPASGKIVWEHAAPGLNWRAVQPHRIGDGGILIGSEDMGLMLIDVTRSGSSRADAAGGDNAQGDRAWSTAQRWTTKAMKPTYNDFVVCDGFAYGFDGGVFDCVELATGKRTWKGGRYGHGQVLLLAEQKLLLVLCETGEVALLATNPKKLEELRRFQAIEGKTWNHPVVAHGRLYVRNGEEMACYDVQGSAAH